jgi:hypothetical protein
MLMVVEKQTAFIHFYIVHFFCEIILIDLLCLELKFEMVGCLYFLLRLMAVHNLILPILCDLRDVPKVQSVK